MQDERYEKGLASLQQLLGKEFAPLEAVRQFYPGLAELIVCNGFGDIYSRPGLDIKQRELVSLSSLISQGAVEQLDFHIDAALNVGLTPKEIVEVIIHCTAYVGFPKALSALMFVMNTFKERGIKP
ncbi:carboxymuconolactone decarboxylase family protein [Aneurinibacillus terranovensis]|uniref:carboxymuconolactone decarboxylase family protein n=1 Tax=Aneurinibacillus terranovensis TaxID=278991 RepID=UPI00041D6720|nr:carboxymuconolactone decarboxylase family protein [Aneurinibacillus terranovensis]